MLDEDVRLIKLPHEAVHAVMHATHVDLIHCADAVVQLRQPHAQVLRGRGLGLLQRLHALSHVSHLGGAICGEFLMLHCHITQPPAFHNIRGPSRVLV
ncbi:MAG: hypothetical protein HC767_03175 [Akkermansiaceae bacterium]|nr:hypothetical protein [Akkermansiaceae bacterium]